MDGEIVYGFVGRLIVTRSEGCGGEHGENCACVGGCEAFSLGKSKG